MPSDPQERRSRIELRVSNQRAYVWDLDDLAVLRAEHRLCGVLAGTLPHLSQQNVFLGPPLVLLPEEVVLLVQEGLAVLVDDATAHHTPTLEQLQIWNSTRAADVRAQIVAAAGAKGASEQRAMSEDALRKRREREERRAAQARAKAMADNDEEPVSAPAVSSPDRAATPTTELSGTWTVTVPASSTAELPWYSSAGAAYATLDDARAAGVWAYPSNSTERAKCGVFRALWERGCYMGGGIKFGGDFLVYPGDPLRYHSHFVASVLDSPKATLRPMEVVAHGRLGTATKKSHLLCAWDEDKQEASFYSIEWAGFG